MSIAEEDSLKLWRHSVLKSMHVKFIHAKSLHLSCHKSLTLFYKFNII